jgi:hypothetical protein
MRRRTEDSRFSKGLIGWLVLFMEGCVIIRGPEIRENGEDSTSSKCSLTFKALSALRLNWVKQLGSLPIDSSKMRHGWPRFP